MHWFIKSTQVQITQLPFFENYRFLTHKWSISLLQITDSIRLPVSSWFFYLQFASIYSIFFTMVKRCVVQFCADSNKTGHTMQIFPNDGNLKGQFDKFVWVKIADFVEPFEHSVVFSTHFSSWYCTDDSGPVWRTLGVSDETFNLDGSWLKKISLFF